ncbi:hypothetical protein BU26DRAFT_582164 [Trematosphaeria pertusa]|uniref:Uncharacterized protein n=1 Tax=Trematosphaeria pertusa TaxID=390896 RepID=A0A6A6HY17_9PLEO|nr:uncharacterized protein BU26DRAFT_582164 [Trematosphaeria pertusa]KAF2243115.1 hypothetical protein BU26DRAFT_582164 [Trematosphaeria pertusa]
MSLHLKAFLGFSRTAASASKTSSEKCYLLQLPAELRVNVYDKIALNGFLPYADPRDYQGLFLSCKQIHDEMEQECFRAAPGVLDHLQSKLDHFLNLEPLQPKSFSELMNLTVSIPRWALHSPRKQKAMIKSLKPLAALHLSSLKLLLDEQLETRSILTLRDQLPHTDWLEFLRIDAMFYVLVTYGVSDAVTSRGDELYKLRTTYTDIITFATRVNCLVAPNLCSHGHHKDQKRLRYCIYYGKGTGDILSPMPCNVRKVVMPLKKLDPETQCHPAIYPWGLRLARWSPGVEQYYLNKEGYVWWWSDQKGKHGSLRSRWSKRMPKEMVWERVGKGKAGKEMDGIKLLARCC